MPSIDKIKHDHCYGLNGQQAKVCDGDIPSDNLAPCIRADENVYSETDILKSLSLTVDERIKLEEQTRAQTSSAKWFEARRQRITGSKCGRILMQKEKTVALLQYCIYPKPMLVLPKRIAWGKRNKHKACKAYMNYMNSHGHPGLQTARCRFVVHLEKGWLGASPNDWVTDPSMNACNGIVEFKCPFTKAETYPEEACKDDGFCSTVVDGEVKLKHHHAYYHHQV